MPPQLPSSGSHSNAAGSVRSTTWRSWASETSGSTCGGSIGWTHAGGRIVSSVADRPAVVGAGEADEVAPARCVTHEAQREVDRLAAAVDAEHDIERVGREAGEPLGEAPEGVVEEARVRVQAAQLAPAASVTAGWACPSTATLLTMSR